MKQQVYGTYRTVKRHATSDETPARIKTILPKPEPVPEGSFCSPPMVVVVCKAAIALLATTSVFPAPVFYDILLDLAQMQHSFNARADQYLSSW